MLELAFALALISDPAAPPRNCTLTRLSGCRDTNQLVWDPAFGRAVETFLGRNQADYLYRGSLADQQLDVLGGPPDEVTRIGDLYRFTACRHQSCSEKGVAVLRPDGGIVALGVLHTDCAKPNADENCATRNTLTVFVARRDTPPAVLANLRAWGSAVVARAYTPPGMTRDRFMGMETILAVNGRLTPLTPATP